VWLLLAALCARAQTIKLDGGWQFLPDQSGALKVSDLGGARGWRDVRVGLSWNAQFADLRDYMGTAWYRTTIPATDLRDGRRALLRFGACDYYTEVFVNGQSIGTHEGGYTPFSFDVTEHLHAGANELAVRVVDPPMDERENHARFPQFLYNEIPHGKQNWYVQTGGLWQGVSLEVKPRLYIERVHVTPHTDGEVEVEVQLSVGSGFDGMFNQGLRVTVRNPNGGVAFTTQTLRSHDIGLNQFSGRVKAPKLWSPDTPTLFTVDVNMYVIH
jgi:beta-galactosidase/beta-glucuronidase